jgi:acyl-CoA thioester hydrolase
MTAPDPRHVLQSYPFSVPIRVLWGDLDSLGHVNNVALSRYLEDARVAMIRAAFAGTSAGGPSVRMLLASLSVTYLAETFYPGEVQVAASVGAIGRSSFRELAAIFQDGRCTVLAEAVIVQAGKADPTPILDDARAAASVFSFPAPQ